MQPSDGRLDPLSVDNSALLLVDYQPSMIKSVASANRAVVRSAAVSAAKAARILGVPVLLSAIDPGLNGEVFPELTGMFPGQKVHARKLPSFDAFEDQETLDAVRKLDRKKVVVSGLWTSMCFTFTALHGIKAGYEVYGLIDAAGDSTKEAHRYGVERMLQAGVVPLTTEGLISEWMHDWNNPKAGQLVSEVYSKYGAMLGPP